MELLLAGFVGVLVASGVYLMLRARTFDLVLGLGHVGARLAALRCVAGGLGGDPRRSPPS